MGSKPVGISASRVGAILGLSPYTTQLEAWQKIMEEFEPGFNESMGYIFPEFTGNTSTEWGLNFEDAAVKVFEEGNGVKITEREKFFQKEIGNGVFISCHIDGRIDSKTLYEGKTTTSMGYRAVIDERNVWGVEGSEEVPETYQVQCALQRICTGSDLVKLSVLIFPESPESFEEMGWSFSRNDSVFDLVNNKTGEKTSSLEWARTFSQIGYLKTYNLPKNQELENLVIEKILEFHNKYVTTKTPPECMNYDDFKRLLKRPIGTIIADEELIALGTEYSEITRQIGSSGPLAKRKNELKTIIGNKILTTNRAVWDDPIDKLVVLESGNEKPLITISRDGKFNARRAK